MKYEVRFTDDGWLDYTVGYQGDKPWFEPIAVFETREDAELFAEIKNKKEV